MGDQGIDRDTNSVTTVNTAKPAAKSKKTKKTWVSRWPVWLVFSDGTRRPAESQTVYGRHAWELFQEMEDARIERHLPHGTSA